MTWPFDPVAALSDWLLARRNASEAQQLALGARLEAIEAAARLLRVDDALAPLFAGDDLPARVEVILVAQ